MTERVTVGNLRVAPVLYDFVNNEALPGTDIDPDTFWSGVDKVVADLTPKNQELLARRDDLQAQIDKWHRARVIGGFSADEYKQFLVDISYLEPEPDDFTITTAGVDDEITTTAGPQLVVPILNARFALNAANARWGSLYDALYGTDVISEEDGAEPGTSYNPVRGDKVIAYARRFLDGAVPLASGSWSDIKGVTVSDGAVAATLDDGGSVGLQAPEQFVGYLGDAESPTAVLLVNNGLHVEILIDPESPIGSTDKAGIKDVVLESAITTIMDFEDSVAAVDAEACRRLRTFTDGVTRYRDHPRPRRRALPEFWRQGSTRVLNYGIHDGPGLPGAPVLVVPSLINRGTILDLTEKRSLMRHLAAEGFWPFLVEWGAPGEDERNFDLSDYICGQLELALDEICRTAGQAPAVVGYCMGGNLALAGRGRKHQLNLCFS